MNVTSIESGHENNMTATHTTDSASNTEATFNNLGIKENLLLMLAENGFKTPTPIQVKTIPLGIEGKDIVGIAQTGTGKTLGFGIPMLQRLMNGKNQGLVVLPTRELAIQVNETLMKIGGPLGLRTAVLIGGESLYRQTKDLRYNPNVIIATPGRLIDHLKQANVSLDKVSIIVLDEADHMFDIGFAPQIKEILRRAPKVRQTMLFSATMPEEISKLAMEHLKLPLRIEVAPQGTAAENVDQEIIVVERKDKFSLLLKILSEEKGTVLVFSRTKHGANDIARALRDEKISATEIHSNKTLGQRRQALDGFKKGMYRVLVATDIAARGIDVKDIAMVVNYDLPEQSSDYVHRIGRTGRGGKSGKAVSFATPDQGRDIADIERLLKKSIPSRGHAGASIRFSSRSSGSRGGYRGGGRGGYRGGRSQNLGAYGRTSARPAAGSSSKYKAFDKRFAQAGFNRSFKRR